MPNYGELASALRSAVSKGAKGAKVLRPGQVAEEDAAAIAKSRAEGAPGALPKVTDPELAPPPQITADVPTLTSSTDVATGKPVDQSADAVTPDPVATDPVAPPEAVPSEDPIAAAAPDEVPNLTEAPKTAESPSPVIQEQPTEPIPESAVRLSRASLGDYALDASHMPNFDVMTTTDDVRAVIAHLAEQNKTKVDEARRGVITNEQMVGLANDLNVSTDAVVSMLSRKTGGVVNAETMLAARQILGSSADRLKMLSNKIASAGATDLEKVQFGRQMQFHKEFYNQFMGARAEAGRLLNVLGIPMHGTDAAAARIHEILISHGADFEKAAKAIRMADDVAGVGEIARGNLWQRFKSTSANLINRIFVNGILSGPATHIVNFTSNAIFQMMNTVETALAAQIGRVLGGDERVQMGEAVAMLEGTFGATKDAFRLASKALRTGQTLDDIMKFEVPRAVNVAQLPADQGLLKGSIDAIKQGLTSPAEFRKLAMTAGNLAIDSPTRLLGASDELFKTLAYRGYIQKEAYRHVLLQVNAGELSMENAAQAARDFMENAPESVQQDAEEWAKYSTFQNPLGSTGQRLTGIVQTVPGLRLIVPFIRTPVNIFKASIGERTPLAMFSAKFRADLFGKNGAYARDLAAARLSLGTATAGAVAWEVMKDNITGNGPQENSGRALWLASGRRPYSVRDPITGHWHDYSRLEPFASVVGAVADSVEIGSYINSDPDAPVQDDNSHYYQMAACVVAGIMNNSGNKTFMKGASDFMDMLHDPTRALQNYTTTFASSMVPYSGALRTMRNIADPYLREAWTLGDKLKDMTPGYSTDLGTRYDVFGEVREKKAGTILGRMSPIAESQDANDPVTDEMLNLMHLTHQVPSTMPDKLVEGMRLNAMEYSHLVEASRQGLNWGGVRGYSEELQRVMDSHAYKSGTAMDQVQLLKFVQTQADKAGRQALENPRSRYYDPDYSDRIKAWRQQQLLLNPMKR